MTTVTLPNYRTNQHGHLVPIESIAPLDLLRDDTVKQIVSSALAVQKQLIDFKLQARADIVAFLTLSAEQYGVVWGGKRGNLQLTSFDGRYRIILQVSDTLQFDERLHIAKQLIDECIHNWTSGSNANIRALIEHAFQTDKQGNINKGRVFGLKRLKIDDETWQRAMQALEESIQISSSCEYLRVYQRVEQTDQYKQISLDMAGL